MVFFTCNGCGTAFKKNQVERHLMSSCSRSVSCIDCQKDFFGEEFKAHTKCISEEEKYNGPDWKAPTSRNKGERKQTAWVETVNSVLESGRSSMNPKQIALLNAISKHDNVPRKKPKFLNFIRNIAKNTFDLFTIEFVFDRLEAEWKRQAEENKPKTQTNGSSTENENEGTNGIQENKTEEKEGNKKSKKEKKKNKRKLEDQEEEEPNVDKKKKKKGEPAEEEPPTENTVTEENGENHSSEEFLWGDVIRQILEVRDDKSITLKKLKKKVFAEYYARVGDSKGVKTKEDLTSLLNKKLKKKKFYVNGETVKLVEVE